MRILLTYALSLFICAAISTAQEQQQTTYRVMHTAPDATQLPNPGETIHIQAYVDGLQDASLSMRALLKLDGELLEVEVPGSIDQYDRSEYTLSTVAPYSDIEYTFFLFKPDGSIIPSNSFQISRSCNFPFTAPEKPENLKTEKAEDKVKRLVLSSSVLEREVRTLEQSIVHLEKIAELQSIIGAN